MWVIYLLWFLAEKLASLAEAGAEQGPKMSIYHFLWRQRSEITTNQRGQWTGRYGHKRRLRTIKKEMEKSEDWSLVEAVRCEIPFDKYVTWTNKMFFFRSFRVFCRRPTMGIVLCLLVSDKPITVVIVGNNIGPEYFPSTATIFNYRRPLTQTARAWKWKIHKAQLQRERVSSLAGNKTPTLSAIRSAWRDSFIILY